MGNIPIRYKNGFCYYPRDHQTDGSVNSMTMIYLEDFSRFYSLRIPTLKMINPDAALAARRQDGSSYTAYVKKFYHTYKEKCPEILRGVRLEFENGDTGFLHASPALSPEDRPLVITVNYFSQLFQCCLIRTFTISDDHVRELGQFIIGKTQRKMEMCLRSAEERLGITTQMEMALMVEVLMLMTKQINQIRQEDHAFKHTDLEMAIIRKAVKILQTTVNVTQATSVNLFGVISTSKINPQEMEKELQQVGYLVQDPMAPFYDKIHDDCPYFDISEAEWKFISEYVRKKEYFLKAGPQLPLDIIMGQQRYGQLYKLKYPSEEDDVEPIMTVYTEVNGNNGTVVLYFRLPDDPSCCIYTYIEIVDLHNAVAIDIVREIQLIARLDHIEDLPNTETELKGRFPQAFFNPDELVGIFNTTMAIILTMWDRPDRTRLIREKTLTPSGKSKPPGSELTEDDYIVHHILKSKREAQEYIEREDSGGEILREYVMAEWNVRAYTKTLKSGKVIKIGATTAKRHLPLTEKELRIKL